MYARIDSKSIPMDVMHMKLYTYQDLIAGKT
jgi:hypothetical protein